MFLCIFFYVFNVYLSNIDSEIAEISKKETLNFGSGRRIYVSLLSKNHMKAMLHWHMCGCIFKIWGQWIDYKTIDKAFISLYIYIYSYFALN